MTQKFIKAVTTENTGGGCMVDFVLLYNGQVLGLNDECVVLYDNMEDFWDGVHKDRQCITLRYPT